MILTAHVSIRENELDLQLERYSPFTNTEVKRSAVIALYLCTDRSGNIVLFLKLATRQHCKRSLRRHRAARSLSYVLFSIPSSIEVDAPCIYNRPRSVRDTSAGFDLPFDRYRHMGETAPMPTANTATVLTTKAVSPTIFPLTDFPILC
jgi:hypothetical protein